MKGTTVATWTEDLSFNIELDGHQFQVDHRPQNHEGHLGIKGQQGPERCGHKSIRLAAQIHQYGHHHHGQYGQIRCIHQADEDCAGNCRLQQPGKESADDQVASDVEKIVGRMSGRQVDFAPP